MAASYDLLQRQKDREIRLRTFHIAREELERRTSTPNRVSRLIYMLLEDVPAIDEQFRAAGTLGSMVSGAGPPIVIDATLGKLNEILPGEDDARHIFQAARNGIDYFVTCNRDTILKHGQAVEDGEAIRINCLVNWWPSSRRATHRRYRVHRAPAHPFGSASGSRCPRSA